MTIWKNYHLAIDVIEALQALSAAPGHARLVAGGTDLLLDLQQGRHPPVTTQVDVTRIAEMRCLEVRQEWLYVGAALPLNQIVASPLVYQHARALHEAAGLIGGPQVRNTATLGGNVGHALPAADGTIALLALGAQAEVANLDGRRLIPVEELFLGPGRSALAPEGDLLVGFYLPLARPGQASAFRRVMRPQGVAIAILNMAVWLDRQADRIVEARIAVGPAGPTPTRARGAEAALQDRSCNFQSIDLALTELLNEARFRTSPHRATAEYRRHVAGVLLEETLTSAWRQAAGED
jgi:carbon-monoxide dehydrogenase medium subunit